jgi:NADH-quinone oxidoreductase subunit L
MTAPLLVLAVLSIVGGLINLPAVLPGSGWLHHWLEPVTELSAAYLPEVHLSHSTEWALLGFATLIAAAGIIGAWRLLKPAELVPAREAPEETGIQKVLLRKWYGDEIYDALIVRPIMWVSENVLWKVIDKGIIDGFAVNGSANFARAMGWLGSRLQTGYVGTYVFLFVLGALILLRVVTGWELL